MKHTRRFILTLILATSYSTAYFSLTRPMEKDDSDRVYPKLFQFGSRLLLESTAGNQDNVLISPFSIASALALVSAGATPQGDCQNEIYKVLGISSSHREMANLRNDLLSDNESVSSDTGVDLTLSNSLWSSLPILPEYKSEMQSIHEADILDLPGSFDPVNQYVSEKTSGKINDLFPAGESIDGLTKALLISVVDFKGIWTKQFDKKNTHPSSFYKADNSKKSVQFMYASRDMMAAKSIISLGGASALKLGYGSSDGDNQSDFSALLILPSENTDESMLETIEGLSKMDSLSSLMQQLYSQKVDLNLPRFSVEWGTLSLKESLEEMGVSKAFSTELNKFSAMTSDPDMYLSDVLHKSVMEVTEEGTKAAAATAAVMKTRSLPKPGLEMKFNRPFLFLIVHIPTETPLFVSRISDPTSL